MRFLVNFFAVVLVLCFVCASVIMLGWFHTAVRAPVTGPVTNSTLPVDAEPCILEQSVTKLEFLQYGSWREFVKHCCCMPRDYEGMTCACAPHHSECASRRLCPRSTRLSMCDTIATLSPCHACTSALPCAHPAALPAFDRCAAPRRRAAYRAVGLRQRALQRAHAQAERGGSHIRRAPLLRHCLPRKLDAQGGTGSAAEVERDSTAHRCRISGRGGIRLLVTRDGHSVPIRTIPFRCI